MTVLLGGWVLCAIAACVIGAKKGEPIMGFLAGAFLGPFGVLLAVLSKGDRLPCPFCREAVFPDAQVCPHCRSELRGVAR